MIYSEAVIVLTEFFKSDVINREFGEVSAHEVFDSCSPIISQVVPDLPKDGFGHQSGVYFICSPDSEIYYIGKATKDNLHEEIWGKLKTPSPTKENMNTYPKNYFLNKDIDTNAVGDVTNGNVSLGVLVVSNPILASLSEVYLQSVYYQRNRGLLPKLNSRIG